MHRGSRLMLGRRIALKIKFVVLVFSFLELRSISNNLHVAGAYLDHSKGCEKLACKNGEECVNRKFWCKHSPCPSMTYCSKSKRDSLKGPENCDSVSCDAGFKCLVRTQGCRWNPSFTRTNCRERMARCVSEWEYQNSQVSCADVDCPMGSRCILRESHCYQVPCKLTKSCLETREVKTWFDKCKQLGCPSEEQCFLRSLAQVCTTPPCQQVPDCLSKGTTGVQEQSPNDYCVGWICPPNEKCLATPEEPCRQKNCRITRSCQSTITQNFTTRSSHRPLDIISSQRTLTDLEKEAILDENRKLHNFLNPTSVSNNTTMNWMRSSRNFNAISPTRVSMSHKNLEYPGKKQQYVSPSPSIRSTSFGELPWLTYFKKKAGAQTVQYWIEKSKRNDNYEGFVDWLDKVADLLDTDTYRLWFHELEVISDDIPEFKTWMTHYNLRPRSSMVYNRQLHPDSRTLRTSISEEHRRKRPISYTKPAIYYDFTQEPGITGIYDGHIPLSKSTYGNGKNEDSRLNPANFNFNEIRQYDDVPEFQPKIYPGTSTVSHLMPRQFFKPPQLPVQDLGLMDLSRMNNPKEQWNSWLPLYHQFNPTPAGPEFQPGVQNLNNRTRGFTNNNPPPLISYQQRPQQPDTLFYPQNKQRYQERYEAEMTTVTHWSSTPQIEHLQPKPLKTNQEDLYRNFVPQGPKEKYYENQNPSVSVDVGNFMNQIAGLPQFNQLKNNVIKLDSEQSGPRFLFPPNTDNSNNNNNLPKLLIYFPPPLNFFIYYSVKNQNESSTEKSETTEKTSHVDTRMIIPWEEAKLNLNKYDDTLEKKVSSIETNLERMKNKNNLELNKKDKKQKEFEYIRKIIRELIEYWDDEEKTSEINKEDKYDNIPDKTIKSNESNISENNNQEKNTFHPIINKPTLDSFLEWLSKNKDYKDMLSQKSRRKKPLVYNNPAEKQKQFTDQLERSVPLINSVNPSNFETIENQNAKKVRILVDIDKNPDILQSFFQRHTNAHSNKTDSHKYQIIVNLQDFFDPNEEDIISRKLVDIASNQLHKNVTNSQKLPKTLWVFPIYDDEENDTLINELESNTQQHLNALDSATTSKDNKSESIENSFNRIDTRDVKGVKKESPLKKKRRSSDYNKSDKRDTRGSKKNSDRKKSFDKRQHKRKSEKGKTNPASESRK